MTRKKTISDFTREDLVHDLAYRLADEHFRRGMTMSQMELAVWKAFGAGDYAKPALELMVSRMPLEKPTSKLCPKCKKRTPVRAKDRERFLKTLCGPVTLERNYHYCEHCKLGFHPLDIALDLPEEGELTREMEKRALDFSINDVYGDCAARWRVHYSAPLSENLFRSVAARVGAQCEKADPTYLHEELKPVDEQPAEVLVVEHDGSMLPIRGAEPWKEAKLGVIYRHDVDARAPVPDTARYTAVINGLGEFAPIFEQALAVAGLEAARTVVWLGDGAIHNWTLADQLAPDAVQILDWYHAVHHAVECGKVLLGEDHPMLPLWKSRSETLLMAGEPELLIRELMECIPLAPKRRRDRHDALEAIDDLVRYYENNAHRMKYSLFREHHFPIGSGAAESGHRHVLQVRMKRAGQHWALGNARRMAQLRAAYRTGGALAFYESIQRARRRTKTHPVARRSTFRYAYQSHRDYDRCAKQAASK